MNHRVVILTASADDVMEPRFAGRISTRIFRILKWVYRY